jgi:hypothetical protein
MEKIARLQDPGKKTGQAVQASDAALETKKRLCTIRL